MNAPDAESARAALDAARVVFGPVAGGNAGGSVSSRAGEMWRAAARVLQAASGRPDLDGQLLIGETRRQERLALDAAYPLVALHAWAERSHQQPSDEPFSGGALNAPAAQERQVAADALRVLEQMITASEQTIVRPPPPPPAPPPSQPRVSHAPPAVSMREEIAAPSSHRRVFRSAGFILFAIVVLIVGGGAWYAYSTRVVRSDFEDGLAAYQRGTPEVARIAFAKAARSAPSDERPLIFLGRIAREEGNLPSARRFLDAAIRIAPSNAVANRELAAVLLADGSPELARRFYVRALQLDPNDRLSQGFLGCALHRLGREDEAKRWSDRAGTGDWSACLATPAPPPAASAPSPTTAR